MINTYMQNTIVCKQTILKQDNHKPMCVNTSTVTHPHSRMHIHMHEVVVNTSIRTLRMGALHSTEFSKNLFGNQMEHVNFQETFSKFKVIPKAAEIQKN